MTVEEQLTVRLKQAMRDRDRRQADVLRMVKTMATTERAAPGFSGETDDAFWLGVIGRYVKQQRKALAEFEQLGEAAEEQAEQARYEIEYLSPFLPSLLGEDEVRRLVREAIAGSGAAGAKQAGKVVGAVMKEHRDRVDPQLVKRVALEELG
jgi:uncharacterized protein YqeY